jgi:hypothetical protein
MSPEQTSIYPPLRPPKRSEEAVSHLRYKCVRTSTCAAFGLTVESSLDLREVAASDGWSAHPDVAVRLAPEGAVERCWSGSDAPPVWQATLADGQALTLEHGRSGDHRFAYAGGAVFHLSADSSTLLCTPRDAASPAWKRVLLDSVLFSTALIRGFEALHAAAVELPHGIVALSGASGAGKSTLTAELIRRGASLFADDVLALDRHGSAIRAHPGPPLMNLPAHEPMPGPGTRVLGTFPDELWLAVARPTPAPRRPAAIFLLDPSGDAGVERVHNGVLALLARALRFPHLEARAAERFDLFAALAATTPVFRLRASGRAPRSLLADLVLATVAWPAPVPAAAAAAMVA